jgi:hypothetical protein
MAITLATITPETLAADFSAVLRRWLTADEMAQVLALNKQEAGTNVCHSHDFCDANMAMLKAFEDLGGDLDLEDQDQVKLWNAAWDIAKASGFGAPLEGHGS